MVLLGLGQYDKFYLNYLILYQVTCRTSFALSVFLVRFEGVSTVPPSANPVPFLSFKRSIGSYVPGIP